MPAAMARSLLANVKQWTTARSIRSKTLSSVHLRASTAATGTWPPESVLERRIISGSTPQCSIARKRPVRPRLDLVGYEQGPILLAELLDPGKIAVVRYVDALALNWFDNKCSHMACLQ